MKVFNQNLYPNLEIDLKEKDIISIWMNENDESNVIMIERKNVDALCKLLTENKNTVIKL